MGDFLVFTSLSRLGEGKPAPLIFISILQPVCPGLKGAPARDAFGWMTSSKISSLCHPFFFVFFFFFFCLRLHFMLLRFKEINLLISPWLSYVFWWRMFCSVSCTFLFKQSPNLLGQGIVIDLHSSVRQCLLSACLLPGTIPGPEHTVGARSVLMMIFSVTRHSSWNNFSSHWVLWNKYNWMMG